VDLAVGGDAFSVAIQQHARVEDAVAVQLEHAPAVDPHAMAAGDLGEAFDAGTIQGLGGIAHLGRRTLPRPHLRERGQVGPARRGPFEQTEHLLFVGDDVLAAVRLAQGDPHVHRCYPGARTPRTVVPAPLATGVGGPTLEA
jgi:hypothetical protein